jgi:PAS domain S-box-containing protein
VFDDVEKTRLALLLYIVIAVLFMGTPLYALVLLMAGDADFIALRLAIVLSFDAVLIGMIFAVQRGYVHAVAFAISVCMWLSLALIVILDGSVRSPLYSWFIVVIILGGLMLGPRGLFALATATIVFGVLVFIAEQNDLTATFDPPPAAVYLLDAVLSFVFSGGFVVIAFQSMYRAWKHTAESATLLQAIFDGSSDALAVTDLEGRYLLVSSAAAKLLGRSVEECLGHTRRELFPAEFADPFHNVDQEVIATGEPHVNEANNAPSGIERHLVVSKSPLRDHTGRIFGVMTIARDMTDVDERILAEEKLRAELEMHKQIMALKEQFVGMVSHELRTPLSVILSSKDILQRYSDRISEEKKEEHYEKIGRQTRFMTEMIDQLLLRNKFNANTVKFEPEPVDIVRFCREFYDQMRATAPENVDLNFIHENLSDSVTIDCNLIRHILGNLLSNAIKYSPEGGEVRLTATHEDDKLIFTVSDQGIGIPEEDQQRLFEPFHRAGNARNIQGTGLGLSIVHDSVEKHSGAIAYESAPGQGTTFIVTIPLSVELQNAPDSLSVKSQ